MKRFLLVLCVACLCFLLSGCAAWEVTDATKAEQKLDASSGEGGMEAGEESLTEIVVPLDADAPLLMSIDNHPVQVPPGATVRVSHKSHSKMPQNFQKWVAYAFGQGWTGHGLVGLWGAPLPALQKIDASEAAVPLPALEKGQKARANDTSASGGGASFYALAEANLVWFWILGAGLVLGGIYARNKDYKTVGNLLILGGGAVLAGALLASLTLVARLIIIGGGLVLAVTGFLVYSYLAQKSATNSASVIESLPEPFKSWAKGLSTKLTAKQSGTNAFVQAGAAQALPVIPIVTTPVETKPPTGGAA